MLAAYHFSATIACYQRGMLRGHDRQKACKDDVGVLGQVEGGFILKQFPRAIQLLNGFQVLSERKPCYFASKAIPGIIKHAHRVNANEEDFGAKQVMIQTDSIVHSKSLYVFCLEPWSVIQLQSLLDGKTHEFIILDSVFQHKSYKNLATSSNQNIFAQSHFRRCQLHFY